MRVLVVRFSSLGDCILLCPFLEHLRHHGAEEITVVTKRAYVELFGAARGVDRIVALGDGAGLRGIAQVVGSCRRGRYSIIDAHNTLRSRLVCARLGGAYVRISKYHRERAALIWVKRAVSLPSMSERYSELGVRLGFPPLPSDARVGGLDVPPSASRRAETWLPHEGRETIVLAPGSRWPSKRWGRDKFLELARRIAHRDGRRIALLGDERDRSQTSYIAAALGEAGVDLAGRTTIMEAAAIMERSVAFIGNDSGLMHLAESMGLPAVALFGPTVEAFGYYPSLPESRAIERQIPCRPCSRNGSRACPRGTPECLTGIEVDVVDEALADLLADRRRATRIVN